MAAGLPLGARLASAAGAPRRISVVLVSGVEAYSEALEGLRSGLGGRGALSIDLMTIDLKTPSGEVELRNAVRAAAPPLLITVGTEALRSALSVKTEAPVIAMMILRSDRLQGAPATAPPRASVHLDASIASLVAEVIAVFPAKQRIGIIWNSLHEKPDMELPPRLKQHGILLQAAGCSRAEDLVRTFLSFKGKVDFVLVLPDANLYNNTTVKPLILASLENRLPIVGFSSSFVRAGAAAGIYPDFRDIGAQTADLALRYLAGQEDVSDEGPRKLQVAVNQRVMRLLGLDYKEAPGAGPLVFR